MPDPSLRYGLALHTSTPELGLAIAAVNSSNSPAALPRTYTRDLGYELSSQLHLTLQEFIQPLAWSEIGLIAVARGPGGFTGTRVGVVTARTLAQQLDLPLFAVSSLAAVALRDAQAHPGDPTDIVVEMPARRGQVFGAVYSPGPSPAEMAVKLADVVLDQAVWSSKLQGWPTPYRQVAAAGSLGATAGQVLAIALAQWQRGDRPHWPEALPFYGQSPVQGTSDGG